MAGFFYFRKIKFKFAIEIDVKIRRIPAGFTVFNY